MSIKKTSIAAALSLLPLGQPLLLSTLGIATATSAVVLHQGAATAQDASAVARIAKAITVRIEGATQGSGVIVSKENYTDNFQPLPKGIKEYKVLSALHVIDSNLPGEEIYIVTPDKKSHRVTLDDTKRTKGLDLVTIRFRTANEYETVKIFSGDLDKKSKLLASGFPISNPLELKLSKGYFFDKASFSLGGGYRILYTNQTSAGMSGGPVITTDGELFAIHGQGERNEIETQTRNQIVKTGINFGIPSWYIYYIDDNSFFKYDSDEDKQPRLTTDFLLLAEMQKRRDYRQTKKIVEIYNKAVDQAKSSSDNHELAYAYFLRANAHRENNDIDGQISDAMQSYRLEDSISTYNLALLGEGYARRGNLQKSYDSYYKMHLELEEQKNSGQSSVNEVKMNNFRNELVGILGIVSSMMNDNHLTIKWLTQAVKEDHKNKLQKMNLHKILADALLETDKTEDALKAYYASDSYTNQASVKLAIGKLLSDKGKFKEAIQYFTDSIKHDKKPHFVYFQRASAYIEIDEYENAISDYSTMLDKTSKAEDVKLYYELLMLRGLAYQESRNWEKACSDFAEAISLGHPTANDYLLKFATTCISLETSIKE